MIVALTALMIGTVVFPIGPVYAKTWNSEEGGEASLTVEWGAPYITIAEYTTHTLKLGVRNVIAASATATGSMYVDGYATSTGWVTGGFGLNHASIVIKFQAVDTTAGPTVEKVILSEGAPWTDEGTWRLDTMDIHLDYGHFYKFYLYAEVHADTGGLSAAIADFGGIWFTDSRIEWGYISIPNTEDYIGGGGGGHCPYVSAWDGSKYVLDNNLLPASESSGGTDVTDYYLLQQMLAQREDGTYSLLLSEFENEHSFVDYVQLVGVDHSSDVNVAVSPYGEILTYTNPYPAVSAITDENENVKFLLDTIDGNYYEGYNGSCIVLNFGDLDVSQGAKLVIRSDRVYLKSPVYIQTMNSTGEWQTVATIHTRTYWSTDVIDISEYLPDVKGNLKVRLHFVSNDKIDFVGLDTSPQATINVQEGQLVSATHSIDGDVTTELLYSDDTYAELIPVQEIMLTFTLPSQTMETRNYIMTVKGRYYTSEG